MLSLVLFAMVVGGPPLPESWKEPKNPDPQQILRQVREDTQEGRHEVALAKALWFHRNALKHEPALSGVRLSFALSYWLELAHVYPPALEALTKTRDDALKTFNRDRATDRGFEAFHEFAAINDQLGEESLTARAFADLDKEDAPAAKRVFNIAQPALVRAKEYELCAKYLSPEADWLAAAQLFQISRHEQERFGPEHRDFMEKSFTNRVGTLLGLLVVNGRRQEAERIAQKARLEWDSQDFHAAIDSALGGVVPDPWP